MTARAPQAIFQLFADIKARVPQAVLSGIMGDAAHFSHGGYHVPRESCPPSDYSVQLAADRKGPADAASALDVTLPADLMKTCTANLVAAAKAKDPRLRALREFCGTLNGSQTYPWQLVPTNGSEGIGTWDDSHLWHIHLSILREHADDYQALAPIADVFAGITDQPFGGVMAFYKDRAEFEASLATIAEAAAEQAINRRLLADPQHPHGLPNNPGVNLRDVAAAVLLPDTPKPGHK